MMIDMNQLFSQQIDRRASDLHLKVGRPPLFRIAGEMVPVPGPPVTAETMEDALKQVLGPHGVAKLKQEGEIDVAYMVQNVARFRVNCFKRLGEWGMVARAIPFKPPTFEKMTMPAVLKDLLTAPQGMILITGPTGSGKSTTLACMIEHLNHTQPLHIVTIEDPVEFVYTDDKCEINQRQLGSDVASLREALRRVLRQDPDVILLGEMRDQDTIEMAMHAAETGHLVLSTLHTNDAKQTLDRIIGIFPAEARDHIRSMLSQTLHAVVSQRLMRRAAGHGRVAAMEILVNTPNVKELIVEGKLGEIQKAMKEGGFYRMQTFNQAYAQLVQSNLITEEEAIKTSANANELQMMLRGILTGADAAAAAKAAGGPRPSTPAGSAPQPAPPPGVPPGQKPGGDTTRGGLKITRGF